MSELFIMEKRMVRVSVVLYPYITENNRLVRKPFTTFFSALAYSRVHTYPN